MAKKGIYNILNETTGQYEEYDLRTSTTQVVGLDSALAQKLDKNQGAGNAGKYFQVDESGNVVLVELKQSDGIPVGTMSNWFDTAETIPQGWVAMDGAEYDTNGICKPLFDIIGYKYGGSGNKFNVPNLIGKWVKGDTVAGTELEAGLPNITASISNAASTTGGMINAYGNQTFGSFKTNLLDGYQLAINTAGAKTAARDLSFDASLSNPIYGNSDTVQPPSLTAIPIIKAFSADVESIEPTIEQELRTEVALQAGEIAALQEHSIIETYQNGTEWYRLYSDGWCEQGGVLPAIASYSYRTVNLNKRMQNTNYIVLITTNSVGDSTSEWSSANSVQQQNLYNFAGIAMYTTEISFVTGTRAKTRWYVCGYAKVGE